jgi:hypothetical protein
MNKVVLTLFWVIRQINGAYFHVYMGFINRKCNRMTKNFRQKNSSGENDMIDVFVNLLLNLDHSSL